MTDTLEFTPDDEWEDMWDDIYDDADHWQKISEGELKVEFKKMYDQVNAFQIQLADMIADAAYDKTELLRRNLASMLFGGDWMGTFQKRNRGVFPAASHEYNKPAYIAADPAASKQYDMVIDYYKDVQVLLAMGEPIAAMLNGLKLKDGYDVLMAEDSFDEAGFGKDLWRRIDGEIRDVYERCDLGFNHWEYLAKPAEEYYQKNIEKVKAGRMTKEALNKEYRNIRLKNYLDDVKRWPFFTNSFTVDSNGKFSVKAEILTKMSVLDDYTGVVAGLKDIESDMKKTIEDCKNCYEKNLKHFETIMKTSDGTNLMAALHFMVDKVGWFAQDALDVYQDFMKPSDEDPYCLMKKLDVMDEIHGVTWLSPNKKPPKEAGTHYEDLYQQAAKALTSHCLNFVVYQGHQELRTRS